MYLNTSFRILSFGSYKDNLPTSPRKYYYKHIEAVTHDHTSIFCVTLSETNVNEVKFSQGRKGEYLSVGPCLVEDIDVTFILRERLGKRRARNEI